MGFPPDKTRKDVEELVEQCVVAEACEGALATFDVALASLPEAEREMLEKHFSGRTCAELSLLHGISEEQVAACLGQAKQSLLRAMKAQIRVRH